MTALLLAANLLGVVLNGTVAIIDGGSALNVCVGLFNAFCVGLFFSKYCE